MKKKFQVHYDMKISGSIDVEAESEEEAERIVVEDWDYEKLEEEGGMPVIEAEAYEIKKAAPRDDDGIPV